MVFLLMAAVLATASPSSPPATSGQAAIDKCHDHVALTADTAPPEILGTVSGHGQMTITIDRPTVTAVYRIDSPTGPRTFIGRAPPNDEFAQNKVGVVEACLKRELGAQMRQ